MRSTLFAALLTTGLCLAGCQNGMSTDNGSVSVAAPDAINATCPISGMPVKAITSEWHGHTVAFNSDLDARQFDALPEEGQARAMAPIMLQQRGIVNRRCPITGERLTADAPTVEYDGQTVGFCSEADRNQWNAIAESKRAELMREMR